jgi:hypothetical protein
MEQVIGDELQSYRRRSVTEVEVAVRALNRMLELRHPSGFHIV